MASAYINVTINDPGHSHTQSYASGGDPYRGYPQDGGTGFYWNTGYSRVSDETTGITATHDHIHSITDPGHPHDITDGTHAHLIDTYGRGADIVAIDIVPSYQAVYTWYRSA